MKRIKLIEHSDYSEDIKFVNKRLTQEFSFIENTIDRVISDNRLKTEALSHLEESFLWISKAISEQAVNKDQIF